MIENNSEYRTALVILFGFLLNGSPDRNVEYLFHSNHVLSGTLEICHSVDSVGHFPALLYGNGLLGLQITFVSNQNNRHFWQISVDLRLPL